MPKPHLSSELNPQSASEYRSFRSFTTLLKKEVLRFLSVASQTLLAPVVTASLYLLIFGVSLGNRISLLEGFSYAQFVIPGLILMGVVNNSFANTASSLFVSRYLGNIVEILVTPVSPSQFIAAYTLAAMLRGLLVGTVIFGVSLFFADLPWAHPLEAIVLLMLASFIFSQFGLLAALFATNFDTLSMFTNFLILPLIYLGGLFYPVSMLPSPWNHISQFNPLYFLIGGFRGALLGEGDVSIRSAFIFSVTTATVLFAVVAYLLGHGKKLRD